MNNLTSTIIGAAITVHKQLGPGLLESAYETCLAYELQKKNLHVEQQKPLSIVYKYIILDHGYRIDILVNGDVLIELKAVEKITRVHEAQILSYMKFSGCKIGLLFNFTVLLLKRGGIRRFVI